MSMNDNNKADDKNKDDYERVVPRRAIEKRGQTALLYFLSGIFIMIMALMSGRGFLGLALSVIALAAGIGVLLSGTVENKKPAFIYAAAGLLGMAMRFRIPFVQPVAGTLLVIGAMGLFAGALVTGISFLLGLKTGR